jgi:hypothetical protein
VRFEPDYNQFSGAPLVTANGYVFRAYDRPVPAAPQTLLDGNTISLTTVRGNFSASGYRSAVTAVPVSVRENTVTVTNDDPGPITLAVPSELNASEWRSSVFSEQAARPDVSVVDGPGDDTVTVELSGDRYQLELAAVELRERNDDNEVDEPPARYLVPDGSRDVTVAEGERARLVVEARDALNNPRSNAPVRFEVTDGSADLETPDGTTGDPVVVRSDGDGESVAFFEPASGTATVEATLNVGTPAPEKTVTFTVRQSGSATAAGGNGSEAYAVEWVRDRIENEAGMSRSGGNFTFNASAQSSATLFADSTPGVDGGTFTYELGNQSVGDLSTNQGTTNEAGESTVEFTPNGGGGTYVYVSGGGSGDRLFVNVTGIGAGSELPPGSVAFDDVDGDGVYEPDAGEQSYSTSDFAQSDLAGVDLVVRRDASAASFDASADSITVEPGVTVSSSNGQIELTGTSGPVNVQGVLDTRAVNGNEITISAPSIDASGGELYASGSISVTASSGDVSLQNARLDTSAVNGQSVTVTAGSAIDGTGANVLSSGSLTMTASDGELVASSANLDASLVNGQSISLESNGDMRLDSATLRVGSGGSMSGALNQGSRDIFVQDARFLQGGSGTFFNYSPNGVTQNGTPAEGTAG